MSVTHPTSQHPAADHCYRAARAGCGCGPCVAWRKALALLRSNPQPNLWENER